MTTTANLAVHLEHRGQAITGVEGWRVAVVETGWREIDTDALRDAGERAKGAMWLIARLPPEYLGDGFAGEYSAATCCLRWGCDGRHLSLLFESPHRVDWCRRGWSVGVPEFGTYNLALNLQEITDMVRWAVEGK